jgi:hypothetical protein
MTITNDDSKVFALRFLAARKRTLRHLMRALEWQALQMAIAARRGVGKARRRGEQKPLGPSTRSGRLPQRPSGPQPARSRRQPRPRPVRNDHE